MIKYIDGKFVCVIINCGTFIKNFLISELLINLDLKL